MKPAGSALNFATSAGALAIAGAATTHTTTVAISYCIGGKGFTKAAITGGTTPTTDAATGAAITLTANHGRVVVWALDAAGAVKCYAGPIEDLDSAGNFTVAPAFPAIPDTVTPFNYTVLKAGATTSGTWTFGTSNWNATGMTVTDVDVFILPDRPQVS